MADTAVFDVDGTLIDSNYQEALAWFRALRRYGVAAAVWRCHRSIGLGSDRLVTAVAGEEVEAAHGDEIRAAHTEEMEPLKAEVVPLDGAHDLLAAVHDRGLTVVLASSGGKEQVENYLDLLDARDLVSAATTSDDVGSTKPAPDPMQAAMDKVGSSSAVMIGDTPYDAQAAAAIGMPSIAVRSGGFGADELHEAGASRVYQSLRELIDDLDATPLSG